MSLLKRKTALATFGQLLGKIGPLSIPVSGHTALQLHFLATTGVGAKNPFTLTVLEGRRGTCVCV